MSQDGTASTLGGPVVARIVLAAMALAIVGMMGLVAVDASLEANGDRKVIDNETFTPNPGNLTTLSDSKIEEARYNNTVRVWNDSEVEMEAETDYEWYSDNGTLKTIAGGRLAGDSQGNITYGYLLLTEEQAEMEALVTLIPTIIGPGILFLLLLIFTAFIGGWS